MKPSNLRRDGGFTLIEAIVALVIMATALTALYSWVNTDLISLRRAEAVIVTQELAQEALRQLALVPLDSQESGNTELGRYQLRWRARLVEPTMGGRAQTGQLGLYDASLYQVDFSLHLEDEELDSWSLRQLRSQQVRSLASE